MRTRNLQLLTILILIILIVSSCGSDVGPMVIRQYTNGVLVINEGNFQDGDASLSFIDLDTDEVFTGLFSQANKGLSLGDVANDAKTHNGSLFVVVNNSNKIEVVDSTFSLNYTISDLAQPRRIEIHNNLGYVTEWGIFPNPSNISIFNLETGVIQSTLTPGNGAEDMMFVGNNLYVSNTFENTVSVIDLNSTATSTIPVGNSPVDLVQDAYGRIWVMCGGGYDLNFAPLNNGQLVCIDPSDNSIVITIELNTNVAGKLAVDNSKNNIFYIKSNAIYKMSIDSEEPQIFVKTDAISLYGIGVDPISGDVYALDSKGFISNGQVFRYSSSGELLNIYRAGRGPNRVLFYF